jgi:hypothetical protein
VAGHFGVCRGLAESGYKELGPTMHRDKSVLSRPPATPALKACRWSAAFGRGRSAND